jgi:hypothetical protein
MNDSEIEQIIARCKLKDAPVAARTRILAAAHAAWNQAPQSKSVWAWHIWCWPTYYAAAAALLLLLNGIVTGLDERRISVILAEPVPTLGDTPTAIEQLYVELGLDPAVARRLRMLAARPEPKDDINEFLRQKNQLLQVTELL